MKFIFRYIKYLYYAKTKYDVHPPFLFDLITKVFENNSIRPEFEVLEKRKRELLSNKTMIEVSDFGAGSTISKGSQRSIKEIVKGSSKPAKYGRLLFWLVDYFKPNTILELGTSAGFSTAYMTSGSPFSKVITIEGCPNISGLANENFDLLKLRNIELINENFDIALPAILQKINQLDFVFIDGNHRRQPTINYFEQCLSKAVNDTVMIFDDIHWSEEMEEAWTTIIRSNKVTLSVDLFFFGIVFLNKELTKQHFIIKY